MKRGGGERDKGNAQSGEARVMWLAHRLQRMILLPQHLLLMNGLSDAALVVDMVRAEVLQCVCMCGRNAREAH